MHKAAYRSVPAGEPAAQSDGLELALYAKPAMLDGRSAYNPWLQELPDPITKISWDNYAALAPATAARLGLTNGDVVRIGTVELPVAIQPGQHERVVAVALGYGSRHSARFAGAGPQWIGARGTLGRNGVVGSNAAPLLALESGELRYTRSGVTLARTGRRVDLACSQEQNTLTAAALPDH